MGSGLCPMLWYYVLLPLVQGFTQGQHAQLTRLAGTNSRGALDLTTCVDGATAVVSAQPAQCTRWSWGKDESLESDWPEANHTHTHHDLGQVSSFLKW